MNRCFLFQTRRATILCVADRSVASQSQRQNLADLFITRLTVLGAAALGFLVTFLLLDHEIHGLKNVMLPLLGIVPAYLFLVSLNTWWAARAAAKSGLLAWPADPKVDRTGAVGRVYTTGLGLAFGIIAALWYVHSVTR